MTTPNHSTEHHPASLWEGFWGVQLLHVGQSLGLFSTLVEPQTAADSSVKLRLDPAYTELWCQAALASRLLDKTEDGRYYTPPHLIDWLRESEGFTQSHIHLCQRMNETMQAVFHGRALPEPPIALRLILQESLAQNYTWLFCDVARQVPDFAQALQEGQRVLEVGCGVGLGLAMLRSYYPHLEIYGLEADFDCAREAERATRSVIHIGDLPGDRFGKAFDLVICFRALAGATKPEELLAECSRLLKPGGWLVVGSEVQAEDERRKSAARSLGEHFAYQLLAGESRVSIFPKEQLLSMFDRFNLNLVQEIEAPDWGTPLFLCTRQGNSTQF